MATTLYGKGRVRHTDNAQLRLACGGELEGSITRRRGEGKSVER